MTTHAVRQTRRPPKFSWWFRLRYRIRTYRSPLQLRSSIRRLRHSTKHPYLALLRLFIPFPAWAFEVPPPLSPRAIIETPSLPLQRQHYATLINKRAIPVWRSRDTPLRSLYRLYEDLVSDHYPMVGTETEYFWYQNRGRWALERIADPRDPDPIRYAILASLAESLVDAFNWRLGLGMRRNKKHIRRERDSDPYPSFMPENAPGWASSVPAIDLQLLRDTMPPHILDGDGRLVLEINGCDSIFAKRNIVTNVGWLYTI